MPKTKILVDFVYDTHVQKAKVDEYAYTYAFIEKNYTLSTYQNLVNHSFYIQAVNEAAEVLKEELKWLLDQGLSHAYLLDYFSFEYTTDVLYLSIVRQIRDKHHNSEIEIIPPSNRFVRLFPHHIKTGRQRIRLCTNLKIKPIPSWCFKIINPVYMVIFLGRLLLLKRVKKSALNNHLLLFSAKNALVRRGNSYDDTYIGKLQLRLEASGFNYKLTTLETNAGAFGLQSIYSYASYMEIFRSCFQSLRHYTAFIIRLPNRHLLDDYTFLNRIFRRVLLSNILAKSKPSAVLSYSDFYIQGRLIFAAANKVAVPSVAFQHALYDTHHLTTYFSGFHDELPSIFPKHYLIYGEYSRNLFNSYGFPDEKMAEVGFDRIPLTSSTPNAVGKRSVIFVGVGHNYDLAFEYLFKNQKEFEIDSLVYRPHPRERKTNAEIKALFPGVIISDPENESIEDCLEKATYVIGFYSTSMLTALGMGKVVIMYLPHNFLSVHFSEYFGIQVVRELKNIDWTYSGMRTKRILKEVFNKKTDVQYLSEWLSIAPTKL